METAYQQPINQQRRSEMSEHDNRNPQHSDAPKAVSPEQKPIVQPVQQKPVVTPVPPKSPQSEPEKHDQEKKHA
jgi:hypothetical protein